MEIYFDDVLINPDYYTSLSTNFELFDSSFKLGSTASNTFELTIDKTAVSKQPSEVTIYQNGALVATLVVDNIEETDVEYKYTLTDKMVNLDFYYDASESFTNGNATLLEVAQDICNKAGITLATMDFRGYNKKITWYDNTRTAREYIGYIAELNGGYAQIGKDGRLYFIKQNTPSVKTISIDDCEDFKIGEKHKISRVVYEQGSLKYEYGDESGNTLYLNGDNVYITEQIEVEEIFNEINGFEFYSFSTSNCPIDFSIMAGQVITFTDGINEYPTIVGYELAFYGDWYGGYNLEVDTKKQEETQVIGTNEKIKNLSIKVDRESNKITQAIKEISDISDITASKESINGTVSFEKVNQSEPIYVKIHPTGENISYLYPNIRLFPSEDLFLKARTLRFINTTTNEYVDYELPTDLLYYDTENYDEFILDYKTQTCVVNKRVGYNADGTTYLLETPTTVEYDFPKIQLTDGDYTVELLGYHNAYMLIKLMLQNIYTTQFATKMELNSEISQTASEINLSVDKKLTGYSTTAQMNSALSVKADEITSTVNKKLEKYDTSEEVSSKIQQSADSITNTVSSTYATKNELTTAKSEIKQTTEGISSEVSKKVGNDEVISKINQSAEAVGINVNKIELSANDILNLLSGNEINLSGKQIKISSNNFTVDENGKVVITGGTSTNANFNVVNSDDTQKVKIAPYGIYATGEGETIKLKRSETDLAGITLTTSNSEGHPRLYFSKSDGTDGTWINDVRVLSEAIVQTSKESKKKNISKYNEKALDIVKDSEIYEYNFKSEDDKHKKHIGFVIGDEGGEYKTPEQVISNGREGIESYSMTSILWKAFQEYIAEKDEQINQLQNEINELKKECE